KSIDIKQDKMYTKSLKDVTEKEKKYLSGVYQTQISLSFITAGDAAPLHLELTLTRAKFDELTSDLVEKTMDPVRKALRDAELSANDINKVLLVGVSTRIPSVHDAIKKETKKDPS